MKDYFKEQLVKKVYTPKDKKKKIIIIVVSAFIILFLYELISSVGVLNPDYYLSLMLLDFILSVLVIILALRFIANLNKEFEYIYTSGNLDIDVIYNKRKRKRVFSGYVEEFEVMAPYNDRQHLAMYDALKSEDFSDNTVKVNTYVFVAVYKGKKKRFIFEPCPDIIKAIKTDLSPRRLFLK